MLKKRMARQTAESAITAQSNKTEFNQNRFTGNPDPNQIITLNGVTPAEFGTLRLQIKQEPVNPCPALSGKFFCFDRAHHWSLGGEIGAAYGRWDVSLTCSGGSNLPGLDQSVADPKKRIDNNLKKYPVWPILKLQVSYAF
jgi:hypothetical protein